MEGEGHYLALLKKGEGSPIALKEKDSKKGGKLPEELEEFSGTFPGNRKHQDWISMERESTICRRDFQS